MINAVSSATPGTIHAMDKVSKEQLYSPGAYALQELLASEAPPPPRRQSGGFLSFLAKVVFMAAVVCGLAVGLRRYVPAIKNVDLTKDLAKDCKFMEKVNYDIAKSAEWIKSHTVGLINSIKKDKKAEAGKSGAAQTEATAK